MTAKEILGQPFYPHECGSMIECVTHQDALKAMNKYGNQMAMDFADFIGSFENLNHAKHYHEVKTTEQLFDIFIKEYKP